MEYNSNDNSWKEVEIPCKEGKDIFLERRIIEKQQKSINLDDIISNLYSNKSNDIYEVIESNEKEGREVLKDKYNTTINLIVEYLESFGMYKIKEN